MQSTGTALLTLLNGILDFSKIEANRVELEAVPLDPVLLLQDVAAAMYQRALEVGGGRRGEGRQPGVAGGEGAFDVSPEAAFNLALIYKGSGAAPLAKQLMRKHLTF
jgi:signal transduction histidine kinase